MAAFKSCRFGNSSQSGMFSNLLKKSIHTFFFKYLEERQVNHYSCPTTPSLISPHLGNFCLISHPSNFFDTCMYSPNSITWTVAAIQYKSV